MGLTVDIKSDGGALLARYVKNQQVFVPRDSWLELVALKDTIQERLETKTEERWSIGNNIIVATSLFNNSIFLHVRVWWNDQPSRQGVSMPFHEWRHLHSFLQFDDEALLGVSVFKELLTESVTDYINKHCDGCLENWPSQNDHACLVDKCSTANSCIDGLFNQVNIFDFITRLAKHGESKKIVVKRPYQTFHLVKSVKEDDMKICVVSSFD